MPEKALLEKAKYMELPNVSPSVTADLFPFTNYTSEEFVAKWDSKEYTFPAEKTTPMLGMISNATPEQIQHIRKKFARELAEREFYNTEKFKRMNSKEAGYKPALYTESDLTSHIQRCLEPLPVGQATVVVLPKDSIDNYRKDEEGNPISEILGNTKKSLVGNGSVMTE